MAAYRSLDSSDSNFKHRSFNKHSFAISPHVTREVCIDVAPKKKRGSRECRVHAAPAVSCAKLCEETHTSIQVQRRHSGIPCAMVLRLMPCSPRRRIRLVTVAAGLMAGLIRLDRTRHRQLDTSNGCQGHTALPSASELFVCARIARCNSDTSTASRAQRS